jgi:hypothetical protein
VLQEGAVFLGRRQHLQAADLALEDAAHVRAQALRPGLVALQLFEQYTFYLYGSRPHARSVASEHRFTQRRDRGPEQAPLPRSTWRADRWPATEHGGVHRCIYAGSPAGIVIDAKVAAGGLCSGQPCWKPISTKGHKFKDALAAQDGIFKIILKGSTTATSKILFKGKDGALDLTAATLPLSAAGPVSVRVHNSDNANCWGADFSTPFTKNSDGLFKGKTP